jgi:microcystin-dependent protein
LPWNGSAPNKTFGRTDGTRTGSQTWQEADAAGVDIVSDDHDTHDQDIADGLNQALLKDGGNTATANIPMGGFRFTNLGDATAMTQAATGKQVLNSSFQYCSVGGTANTITLSTGFSATAYTAGMTVSWVVGSTNTGATTINVDSLGAKSLVRANGAHTALQPGDLSAGALVEAQYDGTRFQLRSPSASATSADVLARIVKAGSIVAWPHSTVPAGWLECYGQAVSRTTYAELYAAIGTTYGVGDGSTTFNLPDLRGRSIFGEDDMGGTSADRITSAVAGFDGDTLGATGGAQSYTLLRTDLPNVSPTITINDPGHAHGYDRPGSQVTRDSGVGNAAGPRSDNTTDVATTGITATCESLNGGVTQTAFSKMPPAMVLKWIILANPAQASASTLGVHGLQYSWNTSTSGDPGAGRLLVNNGTLASATALNISETDAMSSGVGAYLATWDDSTSTVKGYIQFFKVGAPGTFAIFSVSGSLTDNGGYDTFTVSHVASAGTLSNGDSVSVLFYRNGDKGDQGPTGTVSAAGDGTAGAPGIAFASDTNTGIYRPSADTIGVVTAGSERFRITSSGSVGIGTTTPARKLDIVGGYNFGIRFKQGSQIAISPVASDSFSNGLTFENSGSTHAFGMGYTAGGSFALNFFDGSSTYSNFLTVTNLGNLGIGTTTPSAKLDVDGPVCVKSYTVGTVPSAAAKAGQIIYVSNEAGGAVPAFSDGTNWRRVTDRATIS